MSNGTDPARNAAATAAQAATRAVVERCELLGFSAAGVCRAAPTAYAAEYRQWIAEGRHGSMEYLATDIAERLDPCTLLPGAKSVVIVADRYATGARDARTPGRGRIARYARGEDYHNVVRVRLEALATELRHAHRDHSFRVCVDTAPCLEREHAARAGVGRIGKHTLLIGNGGLGSWLVLGAVVTTLELEPSDSRPAGQDSDPCGACTRCIDACPTGAIKPWSVDGAKCISYLTIEHRGAIDPALGAHAQDWIFGCDICQEVCPHNQATRTSREAGLHPAYVPALVSFDLLDVLGWTEAHWQEARLHGALRRASRDMWVRNAAWASVAAVRSERAADSNSALATALTNALRALDAGTEPPLVREAANGALKLSTPGT